MGVPAGPRHAINVGAVGRYSSPSLVVLGQSLIHIDSAPVTRNHCAKSGTVVAHCGVRNKDSRGRRSEYIHFYGSRGHLDYRRSR